MISQNFDFMFLLLDVPKECSSKIVTVYLRAGVPCRHTDEDFRNSSGFSAINPQYPPGPKERLIWGDSMLLRYATGTFVACIVLLFALECSAQELSLSGTVRDADGVVPGAAVT